MDKTIIKLGPTEFASGLTYTAMSRNKSMDDMCLKPFPCMDRFLNVFNGKYFKMRKHYQKKVRPPLEQKFMDYSNKSLSEVEVENVDLFDEASDFEDVIVGLFEEGSNGGFDDERDGGYDEPGAGSSDGERAGNSEEM